MRTPELLSDPVYHDEEAARLYLQEVRWPEGVFCPFCGTLDGIKPLGGDSMGPGWFYCTACQDKFTVRVGSIFERSHIPLHKWLLAFRLMASSKKGVSAHQLHRTLGITYKSAWFLAMRIREAMAPHAGTVGPLGGEGKVVEADETYVGGKERNRHKSKRAKTHVGGSWGKETMFSLVERDGQVRSMHLTSVSAATLRPILKANIDDKTLLVTDDAGQYRHMHRDFRHEIINHSAEEYVRGEAHTNTVEGYFSILKRGITGTYHHVSQQHLMRYLAEFDFRHNTRSKLGIEDSERTMRAIQGAEGKRLTYRRTGHQAA